jgi:hypothetical protein
VAWAAAVITGATLLTPMISRTASMSSSFMFCARTRTPLAERAPGDSHIRSAPNDCRSVTTFFCSAWPSATTTTTAATPMIMPSSVSMVRRRLALSARRASITPDSMLIASCS